MIEVGDNVEWKYGNSHPRGVAAEVKTHPGEKVQIQSQKGNTITRNADEDNAAVRVERRGDGNNQDVVKRASELTKVEEGKEKEGEAEENGPSVGEKREREAMEKQEKAEPIAEGEQIGELKLVDEAKDKEPKTKKAKLDETSSALTKEKRSGPKSTRGRGRGRGRGKTAATGGRTKKESLKKSASTAAPTSEGGKVEGARGKVDEVVTVEGEEEEGAKLRTGEMPCGDTVTRIIYTVT